VAARRAAALALLGLAACASSRRADVIYLPSTAQVVDRMLALARVGRDDVVYDLGCGDGRIVIAAARDRGARGVCNDIDPARIAESRRNAEAAGVAGRVRLEGGDLFELDLADATVVALYLSPAINRRLRPKLFRELRPGTRVVSHNFDMSEWRPDSTVRVAWPGGGTSAVHLWVLPADVAGTWSVLVGGPGGPRRYRVRLDQEFQRLEGTASRAGRQVELRAARIRGDSILLTLADTLAGSPAPLRLEGRVHPGGMDGTFEARPGSPRGRWRARRS
jgi:SAM-dependent methyltransferase